MFIEIHIHIQYSLSHLNDCSLYWLLQNCQFNMHILHVITPFVFGNRRSKDIKVCSLWYFRLACFCGDTHFFYLFFGGGGAKWAGLCIWISLFSNAQRHATIVYNGILELENATPPPWLIKYMGFFSSLHRNILDYVNENRTVWLCILV